MKSWYRQYESQSWYSNTYLVQHPDQIARAIKSSREWNNVEDSGCNFTCLAMMMELNPAYLASLAAKEEFFHRDSDPDLRARTIGGKDTLLVWDINCPRSDGPVKKLRLRRVWHPLHQQVVTIEVTRRVVQYVPSRQEVPSQSKRLETARRIVKSAHSKGEHVICGFQDHSRLVAGTSAGDYFLWDPDLADASVERNVGGKLTLHWFFQTYDKDEDFREAPAEFWIYRMRLA